ncbi:Pentatricopeptide repeat-containing protein [Rhynchospora pubera]|uniref:Pentatricopeptide repeat-containing protein n=1 Tax=Rhynchospora pubera TaxID=906938 RepID=A0AAV8DMI1_9POAL|nr:Pentatricopeptide repeat-containing protein [Rhynchospora pubera]
MRAVTKPNTIPTPSLGSLLPASLDPSLSVVSLITSRLSSHQSPSATSPPLDPIAERHLIPFLGPAQVTRILLLSLSHPLSSLSFFHWTLSPPVSLTPSPLHFSLLSLSLSFSRHFSHSLSLLSLFISTHPTSNHLRSLLSASKFCNWDPSVFSLLIKALIKQNRLDDALDTCHRVISLGFSPDVHTFNSLLTPLVKLGSFEECWDLYYQMKRVNVVPNIYTYNMLIHALCEGEDVIKAKKFLEEIEDEDGFSPDVVTYNTILNGYCKKRRLNAAFHLFDVMPLRGYCKAGRMREARLLLLEMVASGFGLDEFTCELVVESHLNVGKLLSCLNLVALLRRQGNRISFGSYIFLIQALCAERKPHATKDLLKWMVDDGLQPNIKVYNMIINCFCECDYIKEAFGLKEEMETRGITPNLDTCRSLIGCLCRLGRTIEGEALMEEELVKCGVKPDAVVCTKLVKGSCKEGNLTKAESVLRYFVEQFGVHDNQGYNALLRAYCEQFDVGKAFELQDRMAKLGFVANADTCKSIIYGLSKQQ